MKTIFFAGLVALSLFLVACGPNLPPEPGAPGTVAGGALAGRAFAGTNVEEMFAVDEPPILTDLGGNPLVNNNCPTSVESGERAAYVRVACEDDQYIWPTGYYYCGSEGDESSTWVPFTFTGEAISGSNWLDGSGVALLRRVALVGNPQGCAFLCYSSSFNMETRQWNSHEGKWRIAGCQLLAVSEPTLQEVCVATEGTFVPGTDGGEDKCLPPEPEAPPSGGT